MNNRLTYSFKAFGHPNILATNFKTLEFNKDNYLTERGDCIIGINADFELAKLKQFTKKVKMFCEVIDTKQNNTIISEFKFIVNPNYSSENEFVLRKSFFNSHRTFGFNLNRGASKLDRKIVELLKDPKASMKITLVEGWY